MEKWKKDTKKKVLDFLNDEIKRLNGEYLQYMFVPLRTAKRERIAEHRFHQAKALRDVWLKLRKSDIFE